MDLAKLLIKYDITIITVDPKIIYYKNAITYKSKSGYVILVSDILSPNALLDNIKHEIIHIKLGHLDNRKDLPNHFKEWEVNHTQILE